MEFLTPQKIAAMEDDYKPVVEKYSLQMPDVMYLPINKVATGTGYEDHTQRSQK